MGIVKNVFCIYSLFRTRAVKKSWVNMGIFEKRSML